MAKSTDCYLVIVTAYNLLWALIQRLIKFRKASWPESQPLDLGNTTVKPSIIVQLFITASTASSRKSGLSILSIMGYLTGS